MIRIFVNNFAFFIKKDISILEALSFLGLKVPRFCYHEALSIAGNCRICLVEIDSALKLVASCAQPILAEMQIYSNTVKVLKTRENIMESLLINHPLDCPICDQAGECDLQDQSKVFGGISSRHIFSKRGVENKIIDPCIKTIMTRCIHCTRCVRFAAEITGKPFLGTLNRGRFTEIGGFINHFQDSSEVSGNVIDLCPVGALTAKPYAFKARPWELRSIETIDLTDGLGSNIYVNLKELQIISVLPKNNPNINGQWISNKARFSIDALQRYRISNGFIKEKNNQQKIKSINPRQLLNNVIRQTSGMNFLINDEIDLASLRSLKKGDFSCSNKLKAYNINYRKYSNFYNSYISSMDALNSQDYNSFILLSSNIRIECAVINIKLRIKAKSKKITTLNLGQRMEPNFPVKFINISAPLIFDIIEGKNKDFSKTIFIKSKPIFLIGESFFQRSNMDKTFLVKHLTKFNSNNIVLIINKKSNGEAIKYLNIKPLTTRVIKNSNGVFNFCNISDSLTTRHVLKNISKDSIWMNTHGSELATKCNFILPILSYLEVDGVFLNLENRPQKATKTIENGGSFIFSLLETINHIVSFYNINIYDNNDKKKVVLNPLSYMEKILKQPKLFNNFSHKFLSFSNTSTSIKSLYSIYPFKPIISDFYLTNGYSKYSLNMINYSSKKKINNNTFLNLPL